jgi:hypothetical protein
VIIGASAALLAITVSRLPSPARPVLRDTDVAAIGQAQPLSARLRWIYLMLGLSGLAAVWPLFLVYAHDVLWPTANLGLLGAVQLGGSLLAAATWRPTEADLNSRTARASAALITSVVAMAVVRIPVESRAEEVVTVAALATSAASAATIALALLEGAHREVNDETSVKALTILDVVESTSLQVGLLIAGFLVSASATRTEWLVDPYRVYLLVVTVGIVLGLSTRPLRCALASEGAAPTERRPTRRNAVGEST